MRFLSKNKYFHTKSPAKRLDRLLVAGDFCMPAGDRSPSPVDNSVKNSLRNIANFSRNMSLGLVICRWSVV
jgi:hypothetical protein